MTEDFAGFLQLPTAPISSRIHVRLIAEKPEATRPTLRLGPAAISGWWKNRTARYPDGAMVRLRARKEDRALEIFSDSPERARELAFLALLSMIGELLESQGYIRLHALGLIVDGETSVYLGLSGTGKSSSAYQALREQTALILSDEILFAAQDGTVLGLPLRMSLAPSVAAALQADLENAREFRRTGYRTKLLFPIPLSSIAEQGRITRFIAVFPEDAVGTRLFWPAEWIVNIVMGRHLPQIVELALRLDTILPLTKFAVRRLSFAVRMALFGRVRFLEARANPLQNWEQLKPILKRQNPVGNAAAL